MSAARPSAILLGSKPGSAVALSLLLERGWDVHCVVASGGVTHQWMGGPTLEELAHSCGVRVVSRQEEAHGSGARRADFVISYMYRFLVGAETRRLARRAAVNFHPGPLPEFGGWAFYNVAILEDAPEYGCTCHHMDERFDTGPILRIRRFPIDPRAETAVSLERRTQEEMIRLFVEFCRLAEEGGDLPRVPQEGGRARYLSRAQFEGLKEVPPGSDPETIDRYARAFWFPPYDGAWMRVGEARVEIVPRGAKEEMAQLLHAGDFERLLDAARREGP